MDYISNLVSVVIPTYKRSEMLYRAVDSILNQTYKNVECIVVNDNTPGDEYSLVLYKMLNKYSNDKRFHFIEQKVHKNGAAARNVGIKAAKGEYIAFLDDDDFWDLNKAEIQIPILASLPNDWGAVSCLMRLYKNGRLFAANLPYKSGFIHYDVLIRHISMGTGSLIIRRSSLDDTGYFDEELRRFQDPQIFSCLTEKYKIKLVRKYLHNRDVDDAQNRPTIENIKLFQNAFFTSIQDQLERLSLKERKVLRIVFNFDLAPFYWRENRKKQAFLYAIGILKYPSSFYYAVCRIYHRYAIRLFLDKRLKKFR